MAIRPRLVIYNKVDLADVSQSQKEFIKDKIQETGGHTIAGVVFAACADEKDKQLQNVTFSIWFFVYMLLHGITCSQYLANT